MEYWNKKRINSNKSTGRDDIFPRILKDVSRQIAFSIPKVFIQSLQEGRVLNDWKLPNVTPTYKKKKMENAPQVVDFMSLTSVLGKLKQ